MSIAIVENVLTVLKILALFIVLWIFVYRLLSGFSFKFCYLVVFCPASSINVEDLLPSSIELRFK